MTGLDLVQRVTALRPYAFEEANAPLRVAVYDFGVKRDILRQLTKQGIDGYGMSPAQFAAFFRQQHDSFNQIVRENNIRFE